MKRLTRSIRLAIMDRYTNIRWYRISGRGIALPDDVPFGVQVGAVLYNGRSTKNGGFIVNRHIFFKQPLRLSPMAVTCGCNSYYDFTKYLRGWSLEYMLYKDKTRRVGFLADWRDGRWMRTRAARQGEVCTTSYDAHMLCYHAYVCHGCCATGRRLLRLISAVTHVVWEPSDR